MLVTLILPQLILQFVPKGEGFKGGITQSPFGAFKKYQQRIEHRYNKDAEAIRKLKLATTKEEQENIMLGASDEMRQFANSVGISIEKMEKFNEQAKASAHPIQALKAGIKGLGKAFLSYSVQFALIAGLSWAIGEIVKGIDAQINALKYAAEAAENLNKAYEDMNTTQKQNAKTVEEYGKTWEKLKDGVDEQGKNISLSDDEYEQYKNAIEQISNVIPNITSNWNASNEAIKLNIESVDQLNQKMEESAQKQRDAFFTSDAAKAFKDKAGGIDLSKEAAALDSSKKLSTILQQASNGDYRQYEALLDKISQGEGSGLPFLPRDIQGVLGDAAESLLAAKVRGEYTTSEDFFSDKTQKEIITKMDSALSDIIIKAQESTDAIVSGWRSWMSEFVVTQFSSAYSAKKKGDYTAIPEDTRTAIQTMLNNRDADFFAQFNGDTDAMETWVTSALNGVLTYVDDEATKAYQKAAEQWQSGKLSYGDYKTEREKYVSSWAGLATENGELYNMLVPYLRDYFGGGMDEYSAMRQRAQKNGTSHGNKSIVSHLNNSITSSLSVRILIRSLPGLSRILCKRSPRV